MVKKIRGNKRLAGIVHLKINSMSPLILVLIVTLAVSPFILQLAARQNSKTKQKLKQIFLLLLIFQLLLGTLGWESLPFSGRTGFELAFAYPNAFLWLFFVITIVQIALLTSQKHTAHVVAASLNFLRRNTNMAGVGMIVPNSIGKFNCL